MNTSAEVIDLVNEARVRKDIGYRASSTRQGLPMPDDWHDRITMLWPQHFGRDFAEHHRDFWEWVNALEVASPPTNAWVSIWSRGGAKTTSTEAACADLGIRGARRYAWYVNETQDKADKNVSNIAALLESRSVERHAPAHSERSIGKFGNPRGWRRNRIMTAGGFTVDALGLDTAQRGMKVEDQRPDLIILDDVDGKHDSPQTTAKKIETITTSILPAGSWDVAVIAVQNLIIADGFFSRLADGRADYLAHRIVSGPHPAILDLEYVWREEAGIRKAIITGGTPTWQGQNIEVCQRMIDVMGMTAFLKECQHKVRELALGAVIKQYRPERNLQEWSDADLMAGIRSGVLLPFAGIDYGHWRFAFLLFVVDRAGRVHIIDEIFSQRETLGARARQIDDTLQKYGIEELRVYGDPANPTDQLELNQALERGWLKSDGRERMPRWRATAAIKDKGSRLTGPDRINEMYATQRLLVRRGIGRTQRWHLGMNASGDGEPMTGSRFLWEQDNWTYPNPLEGRSQDQNPDDHSADGADMMAAQRYAIMSWLKPPKIEVPEPRPNPNIDTRFDEMREEYRRMIQEGRVA